jgi:hypothetical protein
VDDSDPGRQCDRVGKRHLSAWYKEDSLPRDWVLAVSENGWTSNELGLQWLKHFDKHTKRRSVGEYQLLIIEGHESHVSLAFQQYCKENKISVRRSTYALHDQTQQD